MVAAQPEQLQAQQGLPHIPGSELLPGQNQAVVLDLVSQKQATAMADSISQQAEADKLRYFNWEERETACAAMHTLVSALSDDPINSYFTGSSRRQRKFVKDEVKGYLKALPRAANFIATSDSKAVALWQLLPAETPRNELWAGWTRILAVPPRKWAQLLRLELHYEEAHEAIAATHGPYYYLSFIGTAPEARGRGLGSKLLAEITGRADREGRWCLLEATSTKSEALYARHGFVIYEEFKVSKKCPPVFLMKRAPAPAAAAAAAGKGPLSPVFSIKSVVIGSAGSSDEASLAAAVAAKEAAAGSNGSSGSFSGGSAPPSPLIPVGREALIELLPACTPADAQVIIRSASSASLMKDPTPAAAAAGGSNGSNGSRQQGESPVEYGVSQDEAGHDSSSPAGAGGPFAAAAAGC